LAAESQAPEVGEVTGHRLATLSALALAAAASLWSTSLRPSPAASHDDLAAVSLPQKGCVTGGKVPDLSALPSGTRVFLQSALAIGYPKSGSAAVLAFYSGAHQGDVRAEIRDGAVFVPGKERPVATLDGQRVNVNAEIEVCVYPPGDVLPSNLTGIPPNLIVR
jgi:hypothetical protein